MGSKSYKGFEVRAQNVRVITDAFRLFPEAGMRALANRGMGTIGKDGQLVLDLTGWCALDPWLAVLNDIVRDVGPNKVFEMGKSTIKTAELPPGIDSIPAALKCINIAYHMNHRKDRKVLFDEASGELTAGIGSYIFVPHPNGHSAVMECKNPYPCDLDRGIIVGFLLRFGGASLEHLDEAQCRKRGSEMCKYRVSW